MPEQANGRDIGADPNEKEQRELKNLVSTARHNRDTLQLRLRDAEQLSAELADRLDSLGAEEKISGADLSSAREKLVQLREYISPDASTAGTPLDALETALQEVQEKADKFTESQLVSSLLNENRNMAKDLDATQKDLSTLNAEIENLKQQLDATGEQVVGISELRRELRAMTRQRDTLQRQLSLAEAQLKDDKKHPVLAPERVGSMLDDFVQNIGESLTGLEITDGRMQLKVGFGQVGEQAGMIVPTIDYPPGMAGYLSEIQIRFGHRTEEE